MKAQVIKQKRILFILVTVLIAAFGVQGLSYAQEGNPTITASVEVPLTEATLHESVVTITLSNRKFASSIFDIRDGVSVSGIDGVTIPTFEPKRQNDTVITIELEFNGDFDTDAILTFTVGVDAIADYNGEALTAQVPVTGSQESIIATTTNPLTEVTLHESVVTITLQNRTFASSSFDIRDAVSVSGIDGVTIPTFEPDRESDTVITIELEFNGDFDTDAILTFTVVEDAIADYNGEALTAQVPVTGSQESIIATTTNPLTEVTLHESVVTITLQNRKFARSTFDIRDAVSVSGIDGVTIPWHSPDRESDTVITIELEFNGDFDTDAVLTFTVGADAIANYNGEALTAEVSVTLVEITETPVYLKEDVNRDGDVNILDLVSVANNFGKSGESVADVNGDNTVNILDLVAVAGAFGKTPSAPALRAQALSTLTAADVRLWLSQAESLPLTDATSQRGILFLQQLLAALTPKKTTLLPNFPNPFNPETWIPYHLAKDADVTLHIYSMNGTLVRKLTFGHQAAGVYQSRSRAAYWDGKNEFGEPVASGVYFYTLTAGDFTATRKMLIRK